MDVKALQSLIVTGQPVLCDGRQHIVTFFVLVIYSEVPTDY